MIPGAFHHLHLRAPDPAAAARWYAEQFGGQARTVGEYELALFDGCFFTWYRDGAAAGSVGTAIDHFGWSVPDLEAVMDRLSAAGCKRLVEPRVVGDADLKISFLEDPWGAKLELLEDRELLGFHHLHLVGPEPLLDRVWWQQTFGGETHTYNGLVPGLRFPSMWLLFRASDDALAPTRGRAIDHLGWSTGDVDVAVAGLAARGFEAEEPVRTLGPNRLAFFVAPRGVRVELFQSGQR